MKIDDLPISIKYKIFLPIMTYGLIVIIMVNYHYISYIEENVKKLSTEQLHSIGHITHERIDQFVKQMQDGVHLFNTRVLLRKTLDKYTDNPNENNIKIIQNIIKSSYTRDGDIIDIVILDAKSNIITSKTGSANQHSININEMYQKSKEGIYSHLRLMENGKLPILCISAPVFNENRFVGVSVFKIKLNYLFKILQQRDGLGKSGEALLGAYNNNGDVVLFSPLRFSKAPLIIGSNGALEAFSMRDVLKSKVDKTTDSEMDYRGVPVISSAHYYNYLNIGIVVKKDIKELMQPVYKIKEHIIFIALIVIILTYIIIFTISKYIANIIDKIVEITLSISKGNIFRRIEKLPNDEIGVLSKSINKMADSLVNINLSLEQKIKQKTNQLKISNEKLENLFNITPNITVVTDGKSLVKANYKFFEFTQYETIEAFLNDYNCICDMFIKRDGYLSSSMDGLTWIEYVMLNQNIAHKVIIEKDNIENLFLINATKYIDNGKTYFIVVLENITELQKIAYTDKLTKLMNRVKIDEMLERCTQSHNRYKNIFSIILIVIDFFKLVNDTHGHLVGDEVLKDIAKLLDKNTRSVDLVGRWGGEEFLIISKETDLKGAFSLAEKIRKSIEAHRFNVTNVQTVSIGVAQIKDNETIETLLKRADEALYEAKENGRNKVGLSI